MNSTLRRHGDHSTGASAGICIDVAPASPSSLRSDRIRHTALHSSAICYRFAESPSEVPAIALFLIPSDTVTPVRAIWWFLILGILLAELTVPVIPERKREALTTIFKSSRVLRAGANDGGPEAIMGNTIGRVQRFPMPRLSHIIIHSEQQLQSDTLALVGALRDGSKPFQVCPFVPSLWDFLSS